MRRWRVREVRVHAHDPAVTLGPVPPGATVGAPTVWFPLGCPNTDQREPGKQLVSRLLNSTFSGITLLFHFNLLKPCPSWFQPRTALQTLPRMHKTQPAAYFQSTFLENQAVLSRNILGAKQLEPPCGLGCLLNRRRETRGLEA